MSLRARVLHGVGYLVLRRGIWLPLSLASIALLTHRLGAQAYGLFLTAFALTDTLREIGLFGQEAFLIRMKGEAAPERFHQAFSFVLVSGFALVPVAFILTELLQAWTGMPQLRPLAWAMILSLPIGNLGAVPLASVEHQLRFREVTIADIVAIVANYGVAVPAAYLGAGVWSFVLGYWSERICYAVSIFILSGYRPRWVWRAALLREQLGFGLRYSAAYWSSLLKNLANPLVIGRLMGPQAVGSVGLAMKIVDALAFVRPIAARISMPALARRQDDPAAFARGVREGMVLQTLCTALPLAAFALLLKLGGLRWMLDWLGRDWHGVASLFSCLASASLIGSLFGVPGAALHVFHRSLWVAAAELSYFAALLLIGFILVPHWEFWGYGVAAIAASVSGLWVNYAFRRFIGPLHYGLAPLLVCATLPLCFLPQLGWKALAGPLLFCLWPGAVKEASTMVVALWHTLPLKAKEIAA